MDKCIIYIGDFDLRNENVQAHLVKNNSRIFNALGYKVYFVGINRNTTDYSALQMLPQIALGENEYFELPYTLNIKGLAECGGIIKKIEAYMDSVSEQCKVSYVISYQAPTYAVVLKRIALWCKAKEIPYVVNCADLPIFDGQPVFRRVIMKCNWRRMHSINKKYADGIIAVSNYIADFYHKENRPSVLIPPLFDSSEFPSPVLKANDVASFIYAGTPFKITGREASPHGMKDRLDKIIDLFLMLSEKSADYSFKVVGIFKEDYLNGVPRHRAALDTEGKIIFMGKKTHRETLALVAESDYSINFRDENLMTKAGFSTKIVESVSVGTPVIMNRISDTFDYLKEGVTGFVLTGNHDEDARLIETLCGYSANERNENKKVCYDGKVFSITAYRDKMAAFLTKIDAR